MNEKIEIEFFSKNRTFIKSVYFQYKSILPTKFESVQFHWFKFRNYNVQKIIRKESILLIKALEDFAYSAKSDISWWNIIKVIIKLPKCNVSIYIISVSLKFPISYSIYLLKFV